MSDFELPDLEKYSSLPRNLKDELSTTFEAEQGKILKPFLEKRTKWTPLIGTAFSQLVDKYYDYYQKQIKDGESDN